MTKAVTVVSLFVFAAFCVRSIIMRPHIFNIDDAMRDGGGTLFDTNDSTYYNVYRRLVYSKENNN